MPPKPELLGFPSRKDLRPPLPAGPGAADLAQLQVGDGAGVNEGLSDDGEAGVDVVRLVDVEDKLGVFQDVHPEPERKAVGWGRGRRGEPTPRVCSKGSGRWGGGVTGGRQPGAEDRLALPLQAREAPTQEGTSVCSSTQGADDHPCQLGRQRSQEPRLPCAAGQDAGAKLPSHWPPAPTEPSALTTEPQARSWFSLEELPNPALPGSTWLLLPALARQQEVHH